MRLQRLRAAAGLCRAGRGVWLSGCNPCGGWVRERLPDPEQQYYYVNQGPTYTGPGNFAPYRVYREGSISGYGYGYNRPHYGYRAHRYGHAGRYYGQRVLRRYY